MCCIERDLYRAKFRCSGRAGWKWHGEQLTRHHRHRAMFVLALSRNAPSSPRAAAPEQSSLGQHGNSFQGPVWPLRRLALPKIQLTRRYWYSSKCLEGIRWGEAPGKAEKSSLIIWYCSYTSSAAPQAHTAPTDATGTGKTKTVTWDVPRG